MAGSSSRPGRAARAEQPPDQDGRPVGRGLRPIWFQALRERLSAPWACTDAGCAGSGLLCDVDLEAAVVAWAPLLWLVEGPHAQGFG